MQRMLWLLLAGLLAPGITLGADTTAPPDKSKSQTAAAGAQQEPIYGYELMTEQERTEHRNRMRSFKTEQEREQYRKEHHKKMQERAKARGVTLPDEPPPRGGKGAGTGPGPGPGAGPGPGGPPKY
jgi:hypothetical protein